MSTTHPSTPVAPFRDQSTGLILFGVFQILIGCLCLLMAPCVLLPAFMSVQSEAMSTQMMLPGAAFYLLLAVAFITLGIGSIRARRWARALTLVFSWMWLVFGVASLVFMVLYLPRMLAALPQQIEAAQPAGTQAAQIPSQVFFMIFMVTLGTSGCLYCVLPSVFLLFYQRQAVRATCEYRNPQTCWTDRCPLPVLAVTLALAVSVISVPISLAAFHSIPLFGVVLSGLRAATVGLLMTVLLVWLVRGTYRLEMWSWWTLLLVFALGMASMAVTVGRLGLLPMYEQMGFPPAQLETLRKMGFDDSMGPLGWYALPTWIAMLGYLLYLRRYFVRANTR